MKNRHRDSKRRHRGKLRPLSWMLAYKRWASLPTRTLKSGGGLKRIYRQAHRNGYQRRTKDAALRVVAIISYRLAGKLLPAVLAT